MISFNATVLASFFGLTRRDREPCFSTADGSEWSRSTSAASPSIAQRVNRRGKFRAMLWLLLVFRTMTLHVPVFQSNSFSVPRFPTISFRLRPLFLASPVSLRVERRREQNPAEACLIAVAPCLNLSNCQRTEGHGLVNAVEGTFRHWSATAGTTNSAESPASTDAMALKGSIVNGSAYGDCPLKTRPRKQRH